MSAYLLFLNTQAMVWDYAPNSQWLEARSMRIAYTNRSTIHAAVIEADETPQEIHDMMRETLPKQTDDFDLISIDRSEVADLDATALSQWLENRADWKEWRARHR
jgi:hypothetical protein